MNEKAPERIWIDAAPHLIADATRHIYVEPPPPHFRSFNSVEYVRADITSASVRKEECAAIKAALEDYFKHFFCTCHGSTRTGGHFASCPVTIRDEVLGRLADDLKQSLDAVSAQGYGDCNLSEILQQLGEHGDKEHRAATPSSQRARDAAEEILNSISVNEFREMQRFNNCARIQSLIESKLSAPTTEEGAG